MKQLLLSLVTAFVLLIIIGLALLYNDIDVRFFSEAADVSTQWEQRLRKESDSPLIVFCGGSEVRTCIDPLDFQRQYGLRVVNAGQHAGFKLVCNVIPALSYLRAGDTFVVSVQWPQENCKTLNSMGARYLFRQNGIQTFFSPLFPQSAENYLVYLRYNRAYDYTLLSNILKGYQQHNYEYNATLHKPSGWLEITVSKDIATEKLSYASQEDYYSMLCFLLKLKQYCDKHSVKLVCFLPWRLCGDKYQQIWQYNNINFALLLTQHHIAVLRDEKLGSTTDHSLFSDTGLHQNKKGVKAYTKCLGQLLLSGSYWKAEELENLLKQYAPDAVAR